MSVLGYVKQPRHQVRDVVLAELQSKLNAAQIKKSQSKIHIYRPNQLPKFIINTEQQQQQKSQQQQQVKSEEKKNSKNGEQIKAKTEEKGAGEEEDGIDDNRLEQILKEKSVKSEISDSVTSRSNVPITTASSGATSARRPFVAQIITPSSSSLSSVRSSSSSSSSISSSSRPTFTPEIIAPSAVNSLSSDSTSLELLEPTLEEDSEDEDDDDDAQDGQNEEEIEKRRQRKREREVKEEEEIAERRAIARRKAQEQRKLEEGEAESNPTIKLEEREISPASIIALPSTSPQSPPSRTSSGSDESDSNSDSDDSDSRRRSRLLKPVFRSSSSRSTLKEQSKQWEREEQDYQIEQEEKIKRKVEAKEKAKILIQQQAQMKLEKGLDATDSVEPVMPDDEDRSEDEEEEFELWKQRELRRLKRDEEERQEREKEQKEIERRRKMTDAEIEQENLLLKKAKDQGLDPPASSASSHDDFDPNKPKSLQKYYHKGSYYVDESDPLFQRDYTEATGEDHRTLDFLPKPLQMKKFGRKGNTKYSNLRDEDTSRKGSSDRIWGDEKQKNAPVVDGKNKRKHI